MVAHTFVISDRYKIRLILRDECEMVLRAFDYRSR